MNDMLTPFIRSSNAHKRIIINHNSNEYEAFFDEDYGVENNISKYESNERKYETGIGVNVFGYLIGDGKNQKQPRIVRNENVVQIRFARERIVVQDEDALENLDFKGLCTVARLFIKEKVCFVCKLTFD